MAFVFLAGIKTTFSLLRLICPATSQDDMIRVGDSIDEIISKSVKMNFMSTRTWIGIECVLMLVIQAINLALWWDQHFNGKKEVSKALEVTPWIVYVTANVI